MGGRALRFVDWFCGVGGIRLGMARAGHVCVWSCEIDPFARAVYGVRYGNEPQGKDINDVSAGQIPDADLWVGGFPCQDVSTAGKRAGLEGGTRSGLVWKLLALAQEKKPRWILLENVPGLLSVDKGRGFGRLLLALEELGYDVAWRVLDARYMGVPQRRRRVFILAGRAGEGADPAQVFLEPEGVLGDPAACRKARKGSPGGAETGAGGGGQEVAGTLGGGSGARGWCDDLDRATFIPVGFPDPATTTTTKCGTISPREGVDTLVVNSNPVYCVESPGAKMSGGPEVGLGVKTDESYSLVATPGKEHAVAYRINAAESCAKKDHAMETDYARCIDSTGSFASAQGGTVIGVDIANTIQASAGHHGHSSPRGDGSDNLVVSFKESQSGTRIQDEHGTLDANKGSRRQEGVILPDMQVRRLTPTECERLQGLPDFHTLIRWGKDKVVECPACRGRGVIEDFTCTDAACSWCLAKKPETCHGCFGAKTVSFECASDSLRYRVVGNSVAVPCLKWIGERLRDYPASFAGQNVGSSRRKT